jgi:predicted dinucleotide-binding enzyme
LGIWEAKLGAKATKLGYYSLFTASSIDVHVPRVNEENQDYSEPGLVTNGALIMMQLFTANQMVAAFMDLFLLSINTSTHMGHGKSHIQYCDGN